MRRAFVLILMTLAMGAPGCGHRTAPRPSRVSLPATPPAAPTQVLIVQESGDELARCAKELGRLVAHFDAGSTIVPASQYEKGSLSRCSFAFYLAGAEPAAARAPFAADLGSWRGVTVWVGPGVSALGKARLGGLHVEDRGAPAETADWLLSYHGQQHAEPCPAAQVRATPGATLWAHVESAGRQRPYLVGSGKLWYAAAGPLPGADHFWGRCVWGDLLHEVFASPHQEQRRMVAVLRDVPVWVNAQQAPNMLRPLLSAGVPMAVMAAAQTGDVLLSDRPPAVRGLRQAEQLGATIMLASGPGAEVRDRLRMAWEVGLHPLAWAGPPGPENPFRLRLDTAQDPLPFSAGGLLPSPIPVSDAGAIAPEYALRLRMLGVVRDAVALVSFGLWAPPEPALRFWGARRANGWRPTDLRELDALVMDPRRTVVTGRLHGATAQTLVKTRLRRTVLDRRWRPVKETTVSFASPQEAEQGLALPEGSTAVVEPLIQRPPRRLVKGITLDPWSYTGFGVSADTLAEALAERYSRNGVNTVFCYAYNVDGGAAYRTRYRGASISDWGRQDLLGHLVEACRVRGIRVVAWLYSGRDRGMWLRHPEWRERSADGKEYNPLRLHATYFLCPRNPEVRRWYSGLLADLARRYPGLAGIELCEPLVNWWGDQACYCEVCRGEFASAYPGARPGGPTWRRFRAAGLTEFLSRCLEAVADEGTDTYIMTISDAWSNGAILSPQRQAEESGFDLDALLDGPRPPDWVNFEIIWQQWAAIYGTETFNPDWAAEAAQQLTRRTDGRARVILHVELTDFGGQEMTPAKMAQTISRVSVTRPDGVECYHSAEIDRKAAWSVLKGSFEGLR